MIPKSVIWICLFICNGKVTIHRATGKQLLPLQKFKILMAEELIELDDELENEEGSEELYERVNIIADKGQEPLRIDKFLMNRVEGATRNKIQQACEDGMVVVNDKPVKSNYKVKA